MTIDKYYDITKSKRIEIPFMTNKEALEKYGKVGIFFCLFINYSRYIFDSQQYKVESISHFRENYVVGKIPYSKTKWEERRVLEILNALINFELIDKEYRILSLTISSRWGCLYLNQQKMSSKIYISLF